MVDYILVNATGAVVISALTLIGASYLLVNLWKQGKGKLRVRLLMGTVVSDILVGIIAIPPEAMYIGGTPLTTGSAGCNGLAFVFTTVLFTQHLWTLSMAIATFMLLKYPLHSATTAMERYSWLAWPVIWGISILHSGLWYGHLGFSSSGNICYYASNPASNGLDRDLVQFVPRALVFVTIVLLYSRLFRFLRRPDTIQLSTLMSGSGTEGAGHGTTSQAAGAMTSAGGGTPGGSGGGAGKVLKKPLQRLGRLSSLQGVGLGSKRDSVPFDPSAPWEQLEFVNVGPQAWQTQSLTGGVDHTKSITGAEDGQTPTTSILLGNGRRFTHPASPTTAAGFEHVKLDFSTLGGATTLSPPLETTPELEAASVVDHPSSGREGTFPDDDGYRPVANSLHRPSEADTIVTPILGYEPHSQVTSAAVGHYTPTSSQHYTRGGSISIDPTDTITSHHSGLSVPVFEPRALTPVLSNGGGGLVDSDDDEYEDDEDGSKGRRPSGQTLKEFFQDADALAPAPEGNGAGGKSGGRRGSMRPQMSATAYFNRQASLLMLYFPLAYMFVFSVSLIRLVYDMATHQTNQALSIISAWMVLSVGLIDALVYGMAEFLVKRRVRRKMPDRMG